MRDLVEEYLGPLSPWGLCMRCKKATFVNVADREGEIVLKCPECGYMPVTWADAVPTGDLSNAVI